VIPIQHALLVQCKCVVQTHNTSPHATLSTPTALATPDLSMEPHWLHRTVHYICPSGKLSRDNHPDHMPAGRPTPPPPHTHLKQYRNFEPNSSPDDRNL
jgi:hypothetical protein